MSDEELSKKIDLYAEAAKQNPEIDVNLLMMNALQNSTEEGRKKPSRKWPYLISLGLPPFGLIYAAKYYFSEEDNDKTAAYICVGLTAASLLSVYLMGKLFFNSAGVSPEQIQQIKPADIQQFTQ